MVNQSPLAASVRSLRLKHRLHLEFSEEPAIPNMAQINHRRSSRHREMANQSPLAASVRSLGLKHRLHLEFSNSQYGTNLTTEGTENTEKW